MNHSKTLRLISLLLIFVAVFSSIIAQEPQGTTTNRLNMRSGPSVDYAVVIKLPFPSTVTLLGRNDASDWLYIRSATNETGWVSSAYVILGDGVNVMALPISQPQQDIDTTVETEVIEQPAQSTVVTSSSGSGMTISTLNVRVEAGTQYESLSKIAARTPVIIESRNEIGNWVLVRTPSNEHRGWVATRYVNFDDDVALVALPISTETIGQQPTQSEQPDQSVIIEESRIDLSTIVLPEGDPSELHARLVSIPLFYQFETEQVRSIFRVGQQTGKRPNVFLKAGDSVTAAQPFMTAYGEGAGYDLGAYGYLQDTINYFSAVSPRAGIANSFTNSSLSAFSGATANAIMDTLWADPNLCAGETPLTCEIKLTQPSVGLVLFGTQDMRIIEAFEFRVHIESIVELMIDNGVIPVLSTFHNNPLYYGGNALIYNNVIVDVAEIYDVPLINLWLATQPLPDNGVLVSDPVHLSQGLDDFYSFIGDENVYGVNLRNLVSLQALDRLRINILQR